MAHVNVSKAKYNREMARRAKQGREPYPYDIWGRAKLLDYRYGKIGPLELIADTITLLFFGEGKED